MAIQVNLRNVCGHYVSIVEPKESLKGDKLEYSVQLVLSADHPDLPKLQDTIQTMISDSFKGKNVSSYGLRKRENNGETEFFINVRKNEKFGPVPVYGRNGAPMTPTYETVFSGCIFNAVINLYTFDVSGNRGVGAGLQGLQIVDNVNVARLDSNVDLGSIFTAMDDEESGGEKPAQAQAAPAEAAPAQAQAQAQEQETQEAPPANIPW